MNTIDHVVGDCTCKRATNRWALAIFFTILDVAGLGRVKRNDRKRMFLTKSAYMDERATNPIRRGMQHAKQYMALFGVSILFINSLNSTSFLFLQVVAGPPIDDWPALAASFASRPSSTLCFNLDKKKRKTRLHCMHFKKLVFQQHSLARYSCLECRTYELHMSNKIAVITTQHV